MSGAHKKLQWKVNLSLYALCAVISAGFMWARHFSMARPDATGHKNHNTGSEPPQQRAGCNKCTTQVWIKDKKRGVITFFQQKLEKYRFILSESWKYWKHNTQVRNK